MNEPAIRSRPYSTAACCERCVFGRGEHAEFCRYAVVMVPRGEMMTHKFPKAFSFPIVRLHCGCETRADGGESHLPTCPTALAGMHIPAPGGSLSHSDKEFIAHIRRRLRVGL